MAKPAAEPAPVDDGSELEASSSEAESGVESEGEEEFKKEERSWQWLEVQKQSLGRMTDVPDNPYTTRREYSQVFTTTVDNPAEHSDTDVGLYYNLPSDLSELFPDGVPGDVQKELFAATCKNALMVRKEAVDIIARLKQFTAGEGDDQTDATDATAASTDDAASQELPRMFLIDGMRGIGKSAVLTHVLQYARENGWVTLVVPDAYHVMHGGFVITKSKSRKGMIDQHDIAMAMLQNMLKLHGDQLATATQQLDHPHDRFLPDELDKEVVAEAKRVKEKYTDDLRKAKAEAAARGEAFDESSVVREPGLIISEETRRSLTLKDVAEWGMRHPPLATDALLALKQELEVTTAFPVIIAVDGMNHFYDTSPYPVDGAFVEAEKLSIPHAFRMLGRSGFVETNRVRNGVVLATTSLHRYRFDTLTPYRKQVLVNQQHKKLTEHIEIPRLTRDQVHAQLLHYANCGRFFIVHDPSDVTADSVEYYRLMSDCVPGKLYDVAMFH